MLHPNFSSVFRLYSLENDWLDLNASGSRLNVKNLCLIC